MFCENCGKEMPDGGTFCPHCGFQMVKDQTGPKTVKAVSPNKDMKIALIISFLLTGLGIAYAGNKKKGIILFILGLFFSFLGIGFGIFSVVGLLIWIYGLYETYNEVRIANGESNPNLIEDFKSWDNSKKGLTVFIVLVIFIIFVAGVMSAFSPKTIDNDDYSSGYDSNLDSVDSSSASDGADASSASSGSDGSSYSSSSNGQDVSYHYEDEHGSSDTHGKVYDDGSVESHQKGTTDYGDYQIDSYMDSDGNIHGSVDVGGKTYYVNS